MKQLRIKLVRSPIGRPENQRKVLRGMGLEKLNKNSLPEGHARNSRHGQKGFPSGCYGRM